MPLPVLDPTPVPLRELRFVPPDEAQDASYLAASARMASFCIVGSAADMFLLCSMQQARVKRHTLTMVAFSSERHHNFPRSAIIPIRHDTDVRAI
jgi:hypothetical protein